MYNKAKGPDSAGLRGGNKTRNDIVLIAVILTLVSVASLMMFFFRTEGDTVIVTVDGHTQGEYPLNDDTEVEIRSGDGYNLLIIRDGEAYVDKANCPDGICSSHRPVKHDGESIICLPNKVVVEVHKQSGNQPDIIA